MANLQVVRSKASQLLKYWFSAAPGSLESMNKLWWTNTYDDEICDQFRTFYDTLTTSPDVVEDLSKEPRTRLSVILTFDQLARVLNRGSGEAFRFAPQAEALTVRTLETNEDKLLSVPERLFLLMPLMHAENLDLQEMSVAKYKEVVEDCCNTEWKDDDVTGNVKYAEMHRDVVARFGRFPKRNDALGRESTPEEILYLKEIGDRPF